MPAILGSNATNPTKEDILRTLQTIRDQQSQRQTFYQPQNYQDFMPQTQVPGYRPDNTDMYGQNLQNINRQGDNATALSLTIAQNKAAQEQQKQAAIHKHFAQQQLAASANAAASAGAAAQNSTPPNTSGSNSYNAITGQWGSGNTKPPKLKAFGGINPNAPEKTYNWQGHYITLNSSVAPRFIGFLNALAKTGYKVKEVGGFRKNSVIAGTHQWDLHSLGMAIDINPSQNPVTYNGHNITNLPPNVGSLAARYGIKWGGSWIHSKRDTMHFSVPYGGVE
jgi:hypothetical protein